MSIRPPPNDWTTASDVINRATPGDIIEFDRTIYSHFGVYIGDGKLVQVSGGNFSSSSGSTGSTVNCQSVVQAANDNRCRLNNLVWEAEFVRHLTPRSPEEIVSYARSRIGNSFNYSVSENNCEYFATECRYGRGFVRQPTIVAAAATGHSLAYEVGQRAIAEGRWTKEQVANLLCNDDNLI